jgi:6-pyruvoyltetrahydropterin/6-carboxytetrahydropterin synthase
MNTDLKTELYYVGLVRAFAFEASHQLPEYHGKCAHLHGHSYFGSLQVTADPRNAELSGIVVDFSVLKEAINACVMKYDHKHLNDFFVCPTAELMVIKITQDFADFFAALPLRQYGPINVSRVKLYETANCGAVYPALPANNLNQPKAATPETVANISTAVAFNPTVRLFPKE